MEQIDIIMPVYNSEKYIEEAIESVKKQTIHNWRLIIIDDNSTDNTAKIIKQATHDIKDKVTFIQLKSNTGVANARNVGINKSTNRYITFLDSDDIWKDDKLEKQLHFMKENHYDFSYTCFTYLKNGNYKKVKEIPESLNYGQALKNTFILTSTVMLDTESIAKENIIMPDIESEDTATWWNILKKGNLAYGYKENLTIYRITPNGLSSNKFKNLKKTWNLYRKHEKIKIVKSIYYFLNYVYNASKKRVE